MSADECPLQILCRKTGKAFSVMITIKQSYLHFLLSRLSVLLLKKARLFTQLQNKMFCARRVEQTLAMSHHARWRRPMHASYSTRQIQGKSKISIRTEDIDVVVLAVSFFSRMNLEEV